MTDAANRLSAALAGRYRVERFEDLWELAIEATKAGLRMRYSELDEFGVTDA